jgi:HK97 family phage portal protein
MPLFPTLRRKQTKAVQEDEAKILFASYVQALLNARFGGERARPWDIQRAISEGYERVVWVFRCVDAIATRSSSLTFRLKDGAGKLVEDHPLLTLLNDGKANEIETGRQLRYRISSQFLLSKAGVFVEATTNRAGDVVRYDLLPPGRTFPVPGEKKLIDHFQVQSIHGGPIERIDPSRVRWIRKPHPTDPYSGTTPLEAAGLSVELDYFARLYNANFLRNDGRPGGIVGVKGALSDKEMDALESRFRRGPTEAGKLSVVAGDLTYVDTSATPREMHYKTVSDTGRKEILMAFGVPESQLGNAADRTFANADAETYMYFTLTIDPHNGFIVSGFDQDSDDDMEGFLDTSHIEELHEPERKRREEARTEVAAGLRSIWSYAQLAGIEDVEDTPYTRALWVPSTAVPIASVAGEANPPPLTSPVVAATTQGPDGQQQASFVHASHTQPPVTLPPAARKKPTINPPPPLPVAPAPAVPTAAPRPPAATPPPTAPAALALPAGKSVYTPPRPRLRLVVDVKDVGPAENTQAPPSNPPQQQDQRQPPPEGPDDEDHAAQAALAAALLAALLGSGAQLVNRALMRLSSPKNRKGTRHWEPDQSMTADGRTGTAPLDAAAIVDQQRWETTAEQVAQPLVAAAFQTAVQRAMIANFGDADDDHTATIVTLLTAASLAAISKSVGNMAAYLADLITRQDAAGADLDYIRASIHEWAQGMSGWLKGLVVQISTVLAEGPQYMVMKLLYAPDEVTVVWRSQHDGDVRPTHLAADGQQQPLGHEFQVGEALLDYPGDPNGPPGEVRNCRCRLSYIVHMSKVNWSPDQHPRDQNGRFVHVGERVHLAGGGSGRVERVLHNGKVEVRGDNGKTVVVSAHHVSAGHTAPAHHAGEHQRPTGHHEDSLQGGDQGPAGGQHAPRAADIHGGGEQSGPHQSDQRAQEAPTEDHAQESSPEPAQEPKEQGPPLTEEDAYLAVRNPQMSEVEEASVAMYTADDQYTRLNRALRAGGNVNDDPVSRHVQEAILRSEPLDRDIQVWRGISGAQAIFGSTEDRVGQEFVDGGFGSTSSDPGIAEENFTGGIDSALVQIRLPAGTRAIRPGMVPGAAFGEEEREVLLQAGTRYRMISDSFRGGQRFIELEVVNG